MRVLQKGRGAQINPANAFEAKTLEPLRLDLREGEEWLQPGNETSFTEVFPKSIVNRVDSPDIPANWSMNPYQGCEHGCVYCYARLSHEYWGYSAGRDFEQRILTKQNAPALLDAKLRSRGWKASPIMLSGNTDCYQPIERKLRLTRQLLEVCLRHRHPVGIITKNALVTRDLDLLQELATMNLVQVYLSVTTLDEQLRRVLEPRTSSTRAKLNAIEQLSGAGIPVGVMMAPLIPGLNSDEIFDVAETVSRAGARHLAYTMLRLNGITSLLFADWLERCYPQKASRVMNLIASAQGGQVNNSTFGERMKGKGVYAQQIAQQFKLAKRRHRLDQPLRPMDTHAYKKNMHEQLQLF